MFGASQGFGYGGAVAPTQGATKPARQEDKQTCIPVTVRILQDAVARHSDSQEVLIHGSDASIVHLVGVVEALVKQSAMLEFQINDASGRMKVRFYAPGDRSLDVPGLLEGRYVSVVGNLRTSPAAHVSAMSLQPVASPDEVSFHMIEVAHAALRLRNPTKASPMDVTPPKQSTALGFGNAGAGEAAKLTPAKIEAPAFSLNTEPAAAPPAAAPAALKKDLRTAVLDLLREVGESQEGISITALIAKLPPIADASSGKVKDVLSNLVDEGEAFTTIDDDHFALV